MRELLGRLVREDDAQDLAEYGIALAIIAGFTVAIAVAIGGDVQSLWSDAQDDINQASTAN